MKPKVLIAVSIAAIALPVALTLSKKDVQAVEAYSYRTKSTLPTNINLNDTAESIIRTYYTAAGGYRGNELLVHLKEILKTNQIYYSYESNDAIWYAYEIIDRDWEASPKEDIPTYDAATNTITSYTYNNSSNNPKVHALYVNRDVENQAVAIGNHTNLAWGTNQEHIWAKSHGFETNGQGGARGDLMNLWSGNARVNQTEHNNCYFGYVDLTRDYTTPNTGGNVEKYAHLSKNYQGYSKTLGGSVKVFEPQNCDKGDIARAVFYMVARYNYLSGQDGDGINSNNPNLALTNDLADWSNTGYQSTTTLTGKMGLVSDLLEWNRIDPPDEWEIHRNNLCYENYTNNRNPFIDFPQWADIIWGDVAGTADPANDSLNNKPTLELSHSSITVKVDETKTISASYEANPTASITWSLGDASKATLDKITTVSGETVTITGVDVGTTTITATLNDMSKSCPLTVISKDAPDPGPDPGPTDVDLVSISVSNAKTEYNAGDTFVKPTVTAKYSDDSTKDVSNSENLSFTGQKMSEPGTYTVTVTYFEDKITVTTTYQITVNQAAKKGCMGSVTATSIILCSVSLVGITLLVIKKKKKIA